MFDMEEDNCGPYDNVEFPVRQPGTGTWPRANPAITNGGGATSLSSSSSSSQSSSTQAPAANNAKLFGHHSLRTTSHRLAPLIEVDGSIDTSESNHGTRVSSTVPFPSASFSPSSSSSSSSASSQQVPLLINSIQSSQTNQVNDSQSVSAMPSTTISASSKTQSATNASSTGQNTPNTTRPIGNDTSNYTSAHVVTSMNDTAKRKTLKQMSQEDDDFKRHDLNPGSRLVLENVFTKHPDFYQLNSKVLDEGSLLKQDVNEIYRKSGETLTYEQLLQGMLVDGERFLLGGCWLYFSYVQFLDTEGTKILREPYRKGRVGLTSKRALFLSTETFTDASLQQYGNPNKPKKGGFKLEVSKQSSVLFKNIPLTHFHSAEMEVVTGTSAQTKITRDSFCCGLFPSLQRPGRWLSTAPMTRSVNSRVLRVGVSMPPWQTRMYMDIHLDPSMSLTVARDFISQLHQFAPHMN